MRKGKKILELRDWGKANEEMNLWGASSYLTSSGCVAMDKLFLEEPGIILGSLGDRDEYKSVSALIALGEADR